MKQVQKFYKNGQEYFLSDSALTQSVDTIVQELNDLTIPDSTSDLINDSNFASVSSVTQSQYDSLTPAQKSGDTIFIISDAVIPTGGTGTEYSGGTNIDITNHVISVTGITVPTDVSDLNNDVGYLESSDLKTINNTSLVGSGNFVLPTFTYDSTTQTLNITTT